MKSAWYKIVIVAMVLGCVVLVSVSWRQARELRLAGDTILRLNSYRIGETVYDLSSAADYLDHAGKIEGAEREKALMWALQRLNDADGNLVALHHAGVIAFDLADTMQLVNELRRQYDAVEQMILTGDITGLPKARDRIRELHQPLDEARRQTVNTPALLPGQFKKAYESYTSTPH
jgi:hypothetical protein